MKACAICGQQAHRGSICQDCRAALKRARDETVSGFQPLVLAGAGGASLSDPPHRDERRRALRPVARPPSSIPLPEPIDTGARRANGSRFVWAIVSLMVLAVIVVAAGVINGAIEAARSAAQTTPAAAAEPVPAPAPVIAERTEPVVPPMPREPAPGGSVQDEVAARMHLAPVVPPVVAAPPARPPRAAGRARPVLPETAAPANAPAVESRPAAPSATAQTATPPVRRATAAAAALAIQPQTRDDRWERMAGAMQACSTREFLGRLICEQKVRFEYCEGYWGQVTQCPGGGPVNDHG